jgi:hypothetical protein
MTRSERAEKAQGAGSIASIRLAASGSPARLAGWSDPGTRADLILCDRAKEALLVGFRNAKTLRGTTRLGTLDR